MELIQSLQEELCKNNINEADLIVEKIGELKLLEAVPALITILLETDSNQLRNTIAMALSDIGCEDAVAPLVSLLSSPKTINSRGTLLYALESFDCSRHGELFTELWIKGNYEVKMQTNSLLKINVQHMSEEMKRTCRNKLQASFEQSSADHEKLQEVLKIFNANQ
ncbi:HEAT repeat domain-containing protein [Paenibacillus sp. 1P03SA]|uniref:HEAT repeat domain-containing protein n=1 Tax=Paenibacillus sp. 1P03SA TaxID=3132294 RepID=UPI0039A0A247